MNPLIQPKTTILPLLIALAFACFGFLPQVLATDLDGVLPNNNTADGSGVLVGLTTGSNNSGFGFQALNHDSSGSANTAAGYQALFNDSTGSNNTATGMRALYGNTSGLKNTATGRQALQSNSTGSDNTANGYQSLYRNTTGTQNTATGSGALYSNTTVNGVAGHDNTATGFKALFSNTAGTGNNAFGSGALTSNTTGYGNTAIGGQALYSNTTVNGVAGSYNTANGGSALFDNTTGSYNAAIGNNALSFNTTGSNNIGVGFEAGLNVTTANNVICIGAEGANVSNSCFIGHIRGVTTASADATPVLIDSNGQLGTMSSSERFKKDINTMDKTSEAILAVRPVTFHYKSDAKETPQFGLIAEEVAKVNPDLVVRDSDGEIYTVRYDVVNAMLLNEFLKEHRKVEEQEKAIAELKSGMNALAATAKEQARQIQRVSARLEVGKASPRTVLNDQ
jgi:hypothetical protein